ncbi:MAG: nicotinate-nucleotide--dimethylbenzimidazole phosphoribosyltransferase [Oceanospirillaceae bacterium]|nr:nicotinate-nucleotide--dimethylbenzimidazole phosphoribosyltransferase [Oceanospirillaceae bacterium]MBT12996.1 nicotinate-nucleotide--dimethylbenzimidazole phosphoribosyltransferase [Oceanospirillaceae bacterium]|tara:strand:+ start:40853 stop:41908 length:1056 start_codon:yes stop_codon:yes gene_type:complete
MSDQNWWLAAPKSLHEDSRRQASDHQNQLTKPPGSLGELENIAIRFAAFQGQVKPQLKQPAAVVFAADHGVVAQGVSAFPQAVTVEMLKNFVAGGAAVAVLAAWHQMPLAVVNCGTALPCDNLEGVIQRPVMPGTADFSQQPAMTEAQARAALQIGAEQLERLAQDGCDLFIAGEMGIGNTSAASCLSALLLEQDVNALVGPGTGVQGEALSHKQQVLAASVERARPLVKSPLDALQQCGGLEVAAMTGAYLRAAQLGIPVLVDGFIATSAALLATRLNPQVRDWMLFGHSSAEPGHRVLLEVLAGKPLVQLGMRLGEGSGAAVAVGIIRQALALHNSMATFAEADVSGAE